MPSPVARRLVIHGQVQGVFFRDTLRREAERHGVSGWARNREDGSVEAHLEGTQEAIDQVIAFCCRGPSRASVERVEVAGATPDGATGFRIS